MHSMADNGEEGGCRPERADASPQNTMGYPASTLMEPEVIDLTDRGDETSDNDGREGESECPSQGADSNAQNAMGSQAPTLEENEVIDWTDSGDEKSDGDDGEGEGKFWSQGVRSSSVLQEAPDSTGLDATITQLLSPLSSNIQPEDAVPHGDPLLMAGTGISSSRQSIQRPSGHAIRDSVVYSRQPHKTNQASDQGKRSRFANAFAVPNSSKATLRRLRASTVVAMAMARTMMKKVIVTTVV
ncbi:hypothetical protein BU23DRAFT_59917 [Bimuria novae-zelandiae CBS 107.79]|uniref:Uncharacterized protein n=1 Tax=Bimuria novae-zelandiae CBS 107.79 TaxID=1447943 RepID=A0A6A5VG70_9PLEO|nr:hypothetical protein BU23DRAFT_59917 [Bimuria novae-zelandiae CBS 107.79]